MENRFRLAHLPIASLSGEQQVDVRHGDPDDRRARRRGRGRGVHAGRQRNRLLRAIDRWVIGASLAFCREDRTLDCVFIKLSNESLIDRTLVEWLDESRRELSGVAPRKLCFQVSEENATQYLTQTRALAEQLARDGPPLRRSSTSASAATPARMLAQTPMDYLKIDGSLMQSIATDQVLQEKVRVFISQRARTRTIPDDRRARRERQHDGRAIPARRGLHARPLRARARSRAPDDARAAIRR